jgi:folate-dependent phosphoribosylglycinamide formyltransferase PurN
MLTLFRPFRVAVLSSRRCPGARQLLAGPTRGARWQVVCAVTNEEDLAERDLFASAGVPVVSHPIRGFYRRRRRPLGDLELRREYDADLAAALSASRPDLLLLSSCLYVITRPLLDAFAGRVVNIHGSDLAIRDAEGRPKYLGLRAVADAILAGEPETRATAHWATEEVDLGPPILRSRPFPVAPFVRTLLPANRHAAKAYAHAHQEWMLQEAWGPLAVDVLRLAAAGRIAPESTASWREPAAAATPGTALGAVPARRLSESPA